ncbi:hypothetical protein BJ878DRAFT_479578 [Calycina marina]|uniref:C2H2-type domain-containing protein n=1 Tax=Calycina marina TaxID=1763456 RepID=A0A9P7Z528_9HELO|nr:hypothetical protein BJ878DRAFT_479578 [Calycina marina]
MDSYSKLCNYKAPVDHSDRVTIEPNFPPSGLPKENIAIAIAKNSEIPEILKAAGKLTAEEHKTICYTELKDKRVDVGWAGEEVFTAKHFNEAEIQSLENGDIMAKFMCLRELILRRGKGDRKNHAEFELCLAGKETISKLDRRCYTGGFQTDPSGRITMAAQEKTVLENPDTVAVITRLTAEVATALLKSVVPLELLAMLHQEADTKAPLTFGDETNKDFTTCQFNISTIDGNSLEMQLEVVGTLHIDHNDDKRRWTVLLSMDNTPPNHWPGRTLLTDLRLYAVMAPLTALVFPGVRPHFSLPPVPMGSSMRAEYTSPVRGIADLDPSEFLYLRVKVVSYPKEKIHDFSVANQVQKELNVLKPYNDYQDVVGTSEALPGAIVAFGTVEHQFNSLARIEAVKHAVMSAKNPAKVIPSAQQIANNYRWKEGDTIHMPDVERIEKTIQGNTPGTHKFQHEAAMKKHTEGCGARLSMHSFPGTSKAGNRSWGNKQGTFTLRWVEATALGSKLAEIVAGIEDKGGKSVPKPRIFGCNFCDKRFIKNSTLRSHTKNVHNRKYTRVTPTSEPEDRGDEEIEELYLEGTKEAKRQKTS